MFPSFNVPLLVSFVKIADQEQMLFIYFVTNT